MELFSTTVVSVLFRIKRSGEYSNWFYPRDLHLDLPQPTSNLFDIKNCIDLLVKLLISNGTELIPQISTLFFFFSVCYPLNNIRFSIDKNLKIHAMGEDDMGLITISNKCLRIRQLNINNQLPCLRKLPN